MLYNLKRKKKKLKDNNPIYFQYSDSLNAADLSDTINYKYNQEIRLFGELYSSQKIDSVFFWAINNDVRYYYASYLSHIIKNAYFATLLPPGHPQYRTHFPVGYDELWHHLFDSIQPNSEEVLNTTWYIDYYGWDYMWYNGFYLLQQSGKYDNDKMNENLWKYLFDQYTACFSGKNLEFILATFLWSFTYNRFDIEFIELFEEFNQMFPDSKYLKYVTPAINRVRLFHELADESDKRKDIDNNPPYGEPDQLHLKRHSLDDIHFLESFDMINSFRDAIAPFKGKVIYVDIWATWCGPCIEELKYEEELKHFLKSNHVEMLYISVDKDSYHEKWKDFIKVYNLTGYHIRANKNLNKDISIITGTNAIPWYLIVDKNGIIVEKHAYRPGMKEQLYNQILRYCR